MPTAEKNEMGKARKKKKGGTVAKGECGKICRSRELNGDEWATANNPARLKFKT